MTGNAWQPDEYESRFGFVARYGDDLLDLLAIRPHESVLDLGCGTGRHAAQIAASGARVVGLDADDAMLSKARSDHPGIAFVQADATAPGLGGVGEPFDACISNAALHWMSPQDQVLANVRALLVDGGRFVAEMGGAGNIDALDASLRAGLKDIDHRDVPVAANYFPTVGQQASLLESAGFRVELMTWFRRPTPLAEGTTAADWTRHFRSATWAQVPEAEHAALAAAVDAHAAARGLHTDGGWIADYCRLRFVAVAC